MLYDNAVFLPTEQFYTVPGYEDYHLAKKAHLSALDAGYADQSTHDKWSFLITHLNTSLTDAGGMPTNAQGRLDIQVAQEAFRAFKSTRDTTRSNHFNLSLEQCVNYFEDFYFLYTTDDPQFKLTPAAKKILLQSIYESIAVCETGINGRFYTVLQDNQKETDWIKNELTKARCEALRILQNQYAAEKGTPGSMNVHVYDTMVKLANEERFGIAVSTTIGDIYAGMLDRRDIAAYFHQHSLAVFNRYEKEARVTLTNHYLTEIATILSIDSAHWEANAVNIPATAGAIGDFQRSIDRHFQGMDGVLHSLGELSGDCLTFTLKPKQEVAALIARLVTEKLIADGYYVCLDAIAENRMAHQNIRPKKGTDLDALIALYEDVKAGNTENFGKNTRLLSENPELILSQIHTNPAILSQIPTWLKRDTRFVDAAMVLLDQQLCYAISEFNEERIQTLMTHVFDLVQSQHGYLQQLSTGVRGNGTVMSRLQEKAREPQLPDEAFSLLLKPTAISLAEFMTCVGVLTPEQLLNAIVSRKDHHLPPLPFFSEEKAINELREFIEGIQEKLQPDWSLPYLSIKRRACELEDFAFLQQTFRLNNAVTYLAKTNDWFTGFRQYHAYQTSMEKNIHRLILVARDLLYMLLSVISAVLLASFTCYAFPILVAFVDIYFLPAIILELGLLALYYFMPNDLLFGAIFVVHVAAFLDGFFFWGSFALIREAAHVFWTAFFDVLENTFALLHTMLLTLLPQERPMGSLEEMCEYSIVRLDGLDEISAQQKGGILKTLYAQVLQEKDAFPVTPFKDLLNTKYPVTHQGIEHHVSFAEVAATPRSHGSAFHMGSPSVSMMGFFKQQPTTEQWLQSSVEPAINAA